MTLSALSGIVVNVQKYDAENNHNGTKPSRWRKIIRWLEPGLGVKRWLVVLVLGTTLIGLGLAVILLDLYRNYPEAPGLVFLSMRSLPRWARALVFGLSGFTMLLFSVFKLNRNLLAPYIRPGKPIVDVVAKHRKLGRGPKIVALGGGTGLATLLRGLKRHSGNLTAIVTVTDDGGSSGRLRQSLGIPPPGDLRNCLAALSDDEDLLTQLFQYRFLEGEELNGHSFGNLFIAALAGVTGSFDQGLLDAGRVLSIRGRVIPSTLSDIVLVADKTPALAQVAIRVEGESKIPEVTGQIHRVQLEPTDPPAYPGAIQAILNADMIVIGPGSLFTSIIPNLLVPDIVKAIRAATGFKAYVCNVASQSGETEGFACQQHLEAIQNHVGPDLVDLVIANDGQLDSPLKGVSFVDPMIEPRMMVPIYMADLIDRERPWRHSSKLLAETLIALLEERTGPLELLYDDHPD